jgi:hypothetical protein
MEKAMGCFLDKVSSSMTCIDLLLLYSKKKLFPESIALANLSSTLVASLEI